MERNNSAAAAPWMAQFDGISPLWRHRALLWQFTQRTVELRHKGSHLGLIWSFLNPLLMLGLYVVVFGAFKDPTHSALLNALNIFLGLSLYHFFSEVLCLAPSTVLSNPNFVKKVVFPLDILPVASVGAAFIHFLICMGLALIGVIIWGPGFGWQWLWLPLILIPYLGLALGVAWASAAIGVFFRDLAQFTNFLSLALMFASAVFYPVNVLKDNAAVWPFFRFNPLIHVIELSRDCIIRQQPLALDSLSYICGLGIVAFLGGYWIFHKLRPAFADVL